MSPMHFQITAHGTGGGLVALVAFTRHCGWNSKSSEKRPFFRPDVFGLKLALLHISQ